VLNRTLQVSTGASSQCVTVATGDRLAARLGQLHGSYVAGLKKMSRRQPLGMIRIPTAVNSVG
jgi:hypothetical protein